MDSFLKLSPEGIREVTSAPEEHSATTLSKAPRKRVLSGAIAGILKITPPEGSKEGSKEQARAAYLQSCVSALPKSFHDLNHAISPIAAQHTRIKTMSIAVEM
jgi:hypothetical protein